MRALGTGIGKILEPLGGRTDDVAWMDKDYPRVLKRLAKHLHFAEHGKKLAPLLADFYICGFMRGRQIPGMLEVNLEMAKKKIRHLRYMEAKKRKPQAKRAKKK